MDKTIEYSYNGITYQVQITYKKVKYITYRFRKGVFVITSPKRVEDQVILNGINKFKDKLFNTSFRNEGTDENGIYVLGVYVPFNEEKRIYFQDKSFIEYKDKADLDKKLKKFLLKVITPRVRYYEHMMGIRNPYNVKVKNMVTRFGSNSSRTRSVNFSLILVHYGLDIIDSVIVHELAHEFKRDHSKKFYDIVLKYYPDYYNQHKKLKKGIFK